MSELWSAEEPSSITNFYEKMLSTIWLLKTTAGTGTGFCIDSQGLIMTCDHVVIKDDKNTIICINLKSKIEHAARIVRRKPRWDMALLKLEGGSDGMFDHVEMGNDQIDQVLCGQDVLAIGNPSHTSSLMMGKVTYTFNDYDLSKLLDSDNKEYERPPGFQSHRTVGTMTPKSACDPNLPIIQTTRLNGNSGASGSPLFNERGSVLGMLFMAGICQTGMSIHFQAINHFINLKVDDGEACQKKKVDDGEAGGSQLDKKKGKRGRF